MRPTGLSSAAEFLANFVNFVAPLHLDEGFPTYGRFYPHWPIKKNNHSHGFL